MQNKAYVHVTKSEDEITMLLAVADISALVWEGSTVVVYLHGGATFKIHNDKAACKRFMLLVKKEWDRINTVC